MDQIGLKKQIRILKHCNIAQVAKSKAIREIKAQNMPGRRPRHLHEIGLSEQLKIIPIVNGAVDTPTTLKLLNSPAENHTPARWLTDMVSVCDYLAIDSYDFDKEDPTNPEKTLRTLAFWIRNYSLGKPVLVTEFGYSTGVSYYPDYKTHYHATGTEEQQHDFYAALFPRLVEENRPGGLLNGQVRCF